MREKRGFEVLPDYEALDKVLLETTGSGLKPRRATTGSSGYDFRSAVNVIINPGDIVLIDTGITAYIQEDEELQLRCRSGLSIKGLSLANGVGTIDSDYYGNQIKFIYQNKGNNPIEIKVGDRIGQGIFTKYLLADNDNPISESRKGGFGSTGV